MKVEMNNSARYIENFSATKSKQLEVKDEKVEKETPKTQEAAEIENEKVREIVEDMNKELEKVDTSIKFKVHESVGSGLNRISIEVVEKDSEKVIAEIPSEEAIEFAEKMETITGLLFDHSR